MLKFVIFLLIMGFGVSQTKLKFDDISRSDLQIKYLQLNSEQNVSIRAISPEFYENTNSSAYIWMINSKTREVVWELEESEYTSYSRNLNEYEDDVSLLKGTYEIHFATYMNRNFDGEVEVNGLREILRLFSKGWSNSLKRRDLDEMMLEVSFSDGEELSKTEVKKYQFSPDQKMMYSFNRVQDEEFEKVGLHIKDDLDVTIYAMGEINRDGEYDFAMIKKYDTGETVWKMDYYNTDHMGGDRKNRVYNETIALDEGKYVLYYITDDSHSYNNWNAGSTYDPSYYGITLFVDDDDEDEFDVTNETKFEYNNKIIQIGPLRDDEYEKRNFKLDKDMKIRIYALGEGDDEMVDYSWIIDMNTGRKVWEFKYRDSQHAGGADKNRLIDEVIDFKKGEYIVYAKTDDSHAYRSWNSTKPHDRENWGISLYAVGKDIDEDDYSTFDLSDKRDVLAAITRVRDDEKIKEKFVVNEKVRIHIYAIGEGSSDRMYDYGWIRDDDGNTIWKMRFRETTHAGGAYKNRLYEGVLTLEPGIYYLYYRTDDSHSYQYFNDDKPMDIDNWGITLYTMK